MSDLVERLRERAEWNDGVAEPRIVSALREAAARIEALETQLAAERERCAKIAAGLAHRWKREGFPHHADGARQVEAAIRAGDGA